MCPIQPAAAAYSLLPVVVEVLVLLCPTAAPIAMPMMHPQVMPTNDRMCLLLSPAQSTTAAHRFLPAVVGVLVLPCLTAAPMAMPEMYSLGAANQRSASPDTPQSSDTEKMEGARNMSDDEQQADSSQLRRSGRAVIPLPSIDLLNRFTNEVPDSYDTPTSILTARTTKTGSAQGKGFQQLVQCVRDSTDQLW